MLRSLLNQAKQIQIPKYGYHFPSSHFGGPHHNPGITAKRIIKVCGDTLRTIDPDRWNGVPITFKTNWGKINNSETWDIETCIYIHNALEQEFGIQIKDRHILIDNPDIALNILLQEHGAI